MHRGTGPQIVHAMKYGGWHAIAAEMAERMTRLAWPVDVVEERTAVVPVPLALSRERERGFNQSERIARTVAERWRVPVWRDVLERARATETQTRLTPDQRLANVSGAFRVVEARQQERALRDAHVVLVDDVVTTAATLNACAAALVAGGARIVSYLTFGRAPAAGDR
jgi:ComF family protein